MVFADFYKSPLSKLRHQQPHPIRQYDDWDPELLSRDKEKQKLAVKRYLEEKIRDNWAFEWTPKQRKTFRDLPVAATTARNVKEKVVEVAVEDPKAKDNRPEVIVAQKQDLTLLARLQVTTNPTPECAANHSLQPAAQAENLVVGCDAIPSAGAEEEQGLSRDPGYDPDSGCESDYSVVSEDPVNFHVRTEWESGEETEDDELSYASSPVRARAAFPFRFEDPNTVASEMQTNIMKKEAQRRQAHRQEMEWNDGLACFTARRDVWTGARIVRLKPALPLASSAQEKPLSPLSPRRLFTRDRGAPTSPVGTHGMTPVTPHGSRSSGESGDGEGIFSVREMTSKDTNPSSNSDDCDIRVGDMKLVDIKMYPVVTLLPNPRPLLPPENPMRASITPTTYNSIFEKIVLQGMMPSCPINLADMVKSCVSGWKRRGEWPPRLNAPEPMFARRKVRNQSTPQSTLHASMAWSSRQHSVTVPQPQSSGGKIPVSPADKSLSIAPPIAPSSPPVSSPPPKIEARRKSFPFLTRERSKGDNDKEKDGDSKGEDGTGKVFRRSIQKVLGWYPHHTRAGNQDENQNPTSAGNDKASREGSRNEGYKSTGSKAGPAPVIVSTQLARGRSSVEAGLNTLIGEKLPREEGVTDEVNTK